MPHEFRHLFTPLSVGGLALKNRILSTGHAEAMADDGKAGPRLRAYHEAKARGGVALTIIGGSTSVHPSSPASAWNMIANHNDAVIPGYRNLAEAVHRHGCRVISQLTHMGRRSQSDVDGWHVLLAPSQIPEPVDAARRCREGGLDGVELSFAHNHLVDQFWSPLFNRRTDEYGGSLENRMRFGFEALREIRRQVGRDWVVGARISGDELTAGGLTALDMAEIARRLAASGLVDFLSVIGGAAHTLSLQALAVPNMASPHGIFVSLAAAIKAAVPGMPVFHAGRVVDPVHADRILADGLVDLVGMTRALIADPDMPRKAQEGRLDDVRPCVGANAGCIDRIYQGKPVTCIQNPGTGREMELDEPAPAASPRRVVVVGAGPAGLEAARVAALRGHRVILFEREAEVGGQVLIAARAPVRTELSGILRFLARQVDKLPIDCRLRAEASADTVLAESPDVVIIATGSSPHVPDLPGLDGKHVVTDQDVLLDRVEVGERVVVVDDVHTQRGLSTAEHLLERGHRVEVISRLFYAGQDVGVTSIAPLYSRLFAKGVTLTPHTDLVAVEGAAVVVANVYTRAERRIEGVDTVVLSMGSRSIDTLYRALKDRVAARHAIGDCVAPRGIHQAILEGTRVARLV